MVGIHLSSNSSPHTDRLENLGMKMFMMGQPLLGLQSPFEDKPRGIRVVCPPNGIAALRGLNWSINHSSTLSRVDNTTAHPLPYLAVFVFVFFFSPGRRCSLSALVPATLTITVAAFL